MCNVNPLFNLLGILESFYWGYIGFVVVILAGLYFSFKSGFYQLRVLVHPIRTIKAVQKSSIGGEGISPFRVYFASVGGMVGLGNIVSVVAAVQLGGPGALFWLWVASISGMLIKYAEVYLGMKFRIDDEKGGFYGGPMVYLRKAFRGEVLCKVIPAIYCILLAIYGAEIFQFVVITDVLTDVSTLPRWSVLGFILLITLLGGFGGMRRLANIASAIMPPFIIGYIGISLFIITFFLPELPGILGNVFTSAFTGHAAVGGFTGSSMMMALQLGTSRAVYSGDLGIGYDSIIQSESKAKDPATQACLSIFGVATDSIICTMSILVVLVTGVWNTGLDGHVAVSTAFGQFIPYIEIFMAMLIFISGYTTVIAYLAVGEKATRYLIPSYGRQIYIAYATFAFIVFSFVDQSDVMIIMSLCGGLLMLTNLSGIWNLRNELVFKRELLGK